MWLEILRKEVAERGFNQVAKELGLARSTIHMICSGKYKANTKKVEERVGAIYGLTGKVLCPVLDQITPDRCAETRLKAKMIGGLASNPETIRLYKTCLKCTVRR